MIYSLPPGSMLFKQQGDFVWIMVAGMYIIEAMGLVLVLSAPFLPDGANHEKNNQKGKHHAPGLGQQGYG
jgi:hypothetical protein